MRLNQPLQLLLILPVLMLFSGCGGGGGSYKDYPGAEMLSPDELARYVHACVLANNWEGFKQACVTQMDTTILVNFAGSVREENDMQQRKDKIKQDPTAYERELRVAFNQVVKAVHDAGAYDVDYISAPESPAVAYTHSRTMRTGDIRVHLNNGTCIIIGEPVQVGSSWKVYADKPVQMGTTEDEDEDEQIAPGFASSGMAINKP